MTADLQDLLARVADSVPPPPLLDGVRAQRRKHEHRRQAVGAVLAIGMLTGGASLGWQVHQTSAGNGRFGAAAGYEHIPGPRGWPSARLAPPITTPIDGYLGQDMHLDPLPTGYVPTIDAQHAYAICTEHGACNRNGGTVMTLASVTYRSHNVPLVNRIVWLVETGPSECGTPQRSSVNGVDVVLPSPVTRRCALVSIIDAATGNVPFITVDG